MHRVLSATATIAVVIVSLLLTGGTASAHEQRNVGAYSFEVGWVNEPAYAGVLNGIILSVTDTRTKEPVTGLEKTLKVDVSAGGLAPFTLALDPNEDQPGTYSGPVIPTATGSYTFHITGKVGTQNVDEKFQSGPNTFNDVDTAQTIQYPSKIPVADDLSAKLDALQSSADQSRVLAIAALAVGVVALGAAALLSRRRA